MQEKIISPNKKDLKYYEKYGINTLLLPFKDYSIGFEVYFDIDEINIHAEEYNVYVLVNRFLHRDIDKFKEIYNKFNKKVKFIVEDIGLVNVIDRDRLVLYENHILSNYKAINYLKDLDIKNVVINNDLTYKELEEISNKCKSNMYYFYVAKNMIMYSKRYLVSSYIKHYSIGSNKMNYILDEKASHKLLDIHEENDGSTVRYNKIFCASKYRDKLSRYNLIYDFSFIDELNERMILENIDKNVLCDLIDSDYYFLENDIKYKVGDLR